MKTPIAALVAMFVAGCASGAAAPPDHDAAPLFRTATLVTPVQSPVVAMPDSPNARDGVSIEVRIETSKGDTVLAPRITAYNGQRANVQVVNQTSYVENFRATLEEKGWIGEPIVGIADEGTFLDLVPRAVVGGTALAWALRTSSLRKPFGAASFDARIGGRFTIQLPTWDRAEAEGCRRMENGVWGLLARLPDGKGGTVSVLVRTTPERLEFESKDEDARDIALIDPSAEKPRRDSVEPARENSLPARAAKAALPEAGSGSLDLRAITLVSDLPAGSVVEAEAVAGLSGAETLDPGAATVVTGLVPGARTACLLEERYVKEELDVRVDQIVDEYKPVIGACTSGLTAEVGEDGVLALRWVTTRWTTISTTLVGFANPATTDSPESRVHEARVRAGATTRFVVLAALPGGKVAGVLVRFRPE